MGKKIAMIFGWIFLVLGVLGFIPNPIVGEGALFHADVNHNIVHLLSGIILLWVAYKAAHKARTALKVFAVVYLLIAIIGFISSGSILGLVEINGADNWLHLILAIIFFWGSKGAKNTPAPAPSQPMM